MRLRLHRLSMVDGDPGDGNQRAVDVVAAEEGGVEGGEETASTKRREFVVFAVQDVRGGDIGVELRWNGIE